MAAWEEWTAPLWRTEGVLLYAGHLDLTHS